MGIAYGTKPHAILAGIGGVGVNQVRPPIQNVLQNLAGLVVVTSDPQRGMVAMPVLQFLEMALGCAEDNDGFTFAFTHALKNRKLAWEGVL
jgi:hypothetical protein